MKVDDIFSDKFILQKRKNHKDMDIEELILETSIIHFN